MKIKRLQSGEWLYDNEWAKNERKRKKFKTKREAELFHVNFVKSIESKEKVSDVKTLLELIEFWYEGKGRELVKGGGEKNRLLGINEIMGNPKAKDVNMRAWIEYKGKRREMINKRYKKKEIKEGVKNSTLNIHLKDLKSVFNFAKKKKFIDFDSEIIDEENIKIKEEEVTFLCGEQIDKLLKMIKESKDEELEIKVKICLSIGARWGEVTKLQLKTVNNNSIGIEKSKTGKVRRIPVEEELYKLTRKFLEKNGKFAAKNAKFKKMIERCGIQLSENQATHVLRHTFASHFMMNTGNILVLRDILGHKDIKQTMVYAKFHPEHLKQAVEFNPLSYRKNKECEERV